MAKQELSTQVKTGLVRFSYPHLFKPKASRPGQEPKFSLSIIIPKSDKKTIKDIKRAIENAKLLGKEKWKGKIPAVIKTTFHDGDIEKPEDPAYENAYYVSCSSYKKPPVIDADRNAIHDENDLYPGCYGRVLLNFYPYDADGSKGIAAGLNGVQLLEEGERLGGGSIDVEEAFNDDFEAEAPRKSSSKRRRDDDDDDEDDRPRKRSSRRSDDDDEDDAPRSRKSSSRRHDDDDDDDEPRRRSSKRRDDDDDDYEEDRPRRKASKKYDDDDDDDDEDDRPRKRRRDLVG